MPISPGPIVPNIVDRPATFEPEAEAWTDWLANEHRTQLNALEANVNAKEASTAANATAAASRAAAAQGSATTATTQATAAAASAASALAAPGTSATSATLLTPGLGAKAFVTQSGKAFAAGQTLVVRSASEPRQWMVGVVTSYAGTALALSVTMFGQAPTAGAAADWNITFWGAVPAAAKPGQVLRLSGSTPEWGDDGGLPVRILSARNLMPESNDFSLWGGTIPITPNAGIAPDGTKRATLLSGSLNQSKNSGAAGLPAGVYTFSIHAKAVTPDAQAIFNGYAITEAETTYWAASFNFADNSLILSGTPFAETLALGGGVEQLPDGWVRFWRSVYLSGPGDVLYTYASVYSPSASTASVLFFGAQIRAGASPGVYVPTTGGAASGAGPRKRNLPIYAKQADTNAGWGLGTNSIRVGKAVAPNGRLEATVYRQNAPDNTVGQFITIEQDTQYTASVWAKQLSGPELTATILAVKHDPGTGITFMLVPFGGPMTREWRRYTGTFIHRGATISGEVFAISSIVGADIAVWGIQVEKGPRASNLIDSGATATDGQHADIELRRTHLVDTTHAAVDIAPPADMQPGDWFEVVDVGANAATNHIKVLRGGVPLIDGLAEDFVIDLNNWSGRFTLDAEKGLVIT